jgi:hypothetical protein
MEPEPTDNSPYLPATSPAWVNYYKNAKATRRLGKGQHSAIQRATKRRRRQANLIFVASTALLVAVVAAFCAILGTDYAKSMNGPEGSLQPDSLRPNSLRPDSLRPDSLRPAGPGRG